MESQSHNTHVLVMMPSITLIVLIRDVSLHGWQWRCRMGTNPSMQVGGWADVENRILLQWLYSTDGGCSWWWLKLSVCAWVGACVRFQRCITQTQRLNYLLRNLAICVWVGLSLSPDI